MIRKVYEVDPLRCARCGGTMKIIAVIERSAVVRQILDHMGLPTGPTSLRAHPDPGEGPPGGHPADQPREWSYEPVLDDPSIPDPVMA